MLTMEVIRDKKFDMLQAKLNGVKSIADAQAKGAKVDTVKQITFGAPVFVQSTGTSEPALSGAVAATKAGDFHAAVVKGNGGAYVFQKLPAAEKGEKSAFDAKATEQQLKSQAMQAASRFMQEMFQKSEVSDKRYLFF